MDLSLLASGALDAELLVKIVGDFVDEARRRHEDLRAALGVHSRIAEIQLVLGASDGGDQGVSATSFPLRTK